MKTIGQIFKFGFTTFLLIFLSSNVLKGQVKDSILINSLIGKWYSYYTVDNPSIELTLSGKYIFTVRGINTSENFSYKVNRNIPYFADSLIHNIYMKNDSVYIDIFSNKGHLMFKYLVNFKNNAIYLVSYKHWIVDTCMHIDEIMKYGRDITINERVKRKTIYIIPDNLKGRIYIAFDQKNGKEPEYDKHGNRIYRIPESGVLKTKFKPDIFTIYDAQQEFFHINSKSGLLKKLPFVAYVDYPDYYSPGKSNLPKPPFILSQGINTSNRMMVTKQIGENINGNIEFVEVILE